jgi:TRAP-type mannitol/chloroaromatic compound transport system substrate-binding protein
MDGCYKAANELYAELNQTNPMFKKLHDSYKAFQDDAYLWHQVADYTMEAYMIRYRNMKS